MVHADRKANGLKIFFIVLLILNSLFYTGTTNVEAATLHPNAQKWADVNIDSAPPADFTPETINAHIKERGKSEKARTSNIGNAIFDAATKNGINPALMYSMFIIETGWGSNWKFTDINNPGGIRCKTGYECKRACSTCAPWTKFDTVEQGFQVKAEIIRGYMTDRGVKTIRQMLEIYAPPHENDLYGHQGYIAQIGGHIERFGIDPSELSQTMVPGEGGNYTDGTKVGTWKSQDFFMTSTVYVNHAGVDKDEDVPAIISYTFQRFADEGAKKLSFVGVALCALLLAYVSFTILAYTLIVKGKADAGGIFRKFIVIKGDIYGLGALKQVFVQAILVICIISLYLTGLYIPIMGLIYEVWDLVIYYVFG